METKNMIPYGAAILGALAGNWLYKMKPMYGNIGRGVAIGAGAAGGYFISKEIINRLEKKEIKSVASANARVSEPIEMASKDVEISES